MIPKFRAWFDSEMYDKSVVYDGEFYLDWREFENGETYNGAVLMQSTGLFDKNGKEIFEGDVVRVAEYFNIISEVKYNKDGYYIYDKHDNVSISLSTFDGLEILGNIYENPELMREKHEIS